MKLFANWVCLAQYAWATASPVTRLSRTRPGLCRRIGFVLPKPVACAICHNSFSAGHLLLPLRRRRLALFRTIALRRGLPGRLRPFPDARAQLGLFGAIGSSHGPVCPSGGGKLALFVRRALSRPGGIGFVSHEYSRLFLPLSNRKHVIPAEAGIIIHKS